MFLHPSFPSQSTIAFCFASLSMDASQWNQGSFHVDVKPMEISRQQAQQRQQQQQQQQQQERKMVRPHKDQALNCPRCNSTNTKFCYYNNYSLSQPRFFCKTCRRYWTEGGSLRNVPVGGGSRKNKGSSSSTGPKIKLHADQNHNPRIIHQGQDLNLAFPAPSDHNRDGNPKSPSIDVFKGNTGIGSTGLSLGSFMPPLPILETSTGYSAGFPLVEFRPSLGFPTSDGFENGYGSLQGLQASSNTNCAKLFFPVEDLKHVPGSSSSGANHHHGDPSAYWNGVLGGGSW